LKVDSLKKAAEEEEKRVQIQSTCKVEAIHMSKYLTAE
jgi:hypothetical protein